MLLFMEQELQHLHWWLIRFKVQTNTSGTANCGGLHAALGQWRRNYTPPAALDVIWHSIIDVSNIEYIPGHICHDRYETI